VGGGEKHPGRSRARDRSRHNRRSPKPSPERLTVLFDPAWISSRGFRHEVRTSRFLTSARVARACTRGVPTDGYDCGLGCFHHWRQILFVFLGSGPLAAEDGGPAAAKGFVPSP